MGFYERVTTFAGLPVVEHPQKDDPLPEVDPAAVAWRVGDSDPYEPVQDWLRRFADTLGHRAVALVLGPWGEELYDNPPPVPTLVEIADKLPALRALFVGEVLGEECENSWINATEFTPLLTAYPRLETLRIRSGFRDGTTETPLLPVRHDALRELAIETGGLPGSVVRAVAESDLPALEHLELWLGVDEYGGDATLEDFAPILSGSRWPGLRYLGLRNAEIADQLAAAVAAAPVVARLETLDLSLGVLSDTGAAALLAGQPLTHLRRLDLHHHFLSDEMVKRVAAELPAADLSEQERAETSNGDVWRYTAVSE